MHLVSAIHMFVVLQQEIGDAAVEAERDFKQKFPNPAHWTEATIREFITTSLTKIRQSFLSELKKQMPIADPKQGKEFLRQVKIHYENFGSFPEMTQEKLWMIATSVMDSETKAQWMRRWNQSASLREAVRFLKPGFPDTMFPEWLHKATWWAQVRLSPLFLVSLFSLCFTAFIVLNCLFLCFLLYFHQLS